MEANFFKTNLYSVPRCAEIHTIISLSACKFAFISFIAKSQLNWFSSFKLFPFQFWCSSATYSETFGESAIQNSLEKIIVSGQNSLHYMWCHFHFIVNSLIDNKSEPISMQEFTQLL